MNAPLLRDVTHHLVTAGVAVLRFNFRGVGSSQGIWDNGDGERDDVDSAVSFATDRHPDWLWNLAGWSFGAATSLRWQAAAGSQLPYVGIAPPVDRPHTPQLPAPSELQPAPRSFIIGDRDQFTTVDQLETYAATINSRVTVLKGSDHFFYFREERVAESILAGLTTST